jgi:ribonuclease T2
MMKRLALLVALAPLPAMAQAISCTPPARIESYPPIRPDGPSIRVPIGGYTLALSWSPEFCHGARGNQEFQCGGRQNFGFIVHGLWPESNSGQSPQWCATAPRPSPETLRRYMCMTPSARTLEHEWLKHGSCAAKTPEVYFGAAQKLWQGLRMPRMERIGSAGDLRAAFVAANPSLDRRAIGVKTAPGGWLREVAICYSTKLVPAPCQGRSFGAGDRVAIRISEGR